MRSMSRRTRLIATLLAAVAGYVDATGFIHTGGFFVSFMSGNSTRLAVGLAGDMATAAMAGGLIATFVLGVFTGALAGRAWPRRRSTVVLILVASLLAASALLGALGAAGVAIVALAFAMGAENSVFDQEGEVKVGLTYMTGALVKFSQKLALAATGGPRWDWAPYLLLWSGLAVGALTGALLYPHLGIQGLWLPALACGGAAVACWRLNAGQD